MTKKTSTPAAKPRLNKVGNGRGLKVVTRPVTKKRGLDATEKAKQARIAENRAKHRSLTNMTTAELAELPEDKPLTEKAKLFVRYWAQGDSIMVASTKAGYGDGASYAYRIAHTPAALALYQEEKRQFELASQMTRKRVADGILEGIEMARTLQDPNAFLTGWRDMAKLCGYLDPKEKKVKLTLDGSVTVQRMQGMSDADLLRVIQTGATEALEQLEHDDGDGA